MFRITAPILVGSFLLLAIGVGAAWYVHLRQRVVSEQLDQNVATVRAGQAMVSAAREMRNQINRALLTGDLDGDGLDQVYELELAFRTWLREAQSIARSPSERNLLGMLDSRSAQFGDEFKAIMQRHREGDFVGASLRDLGDKLLVSEVLAYATEYLELNERMVAQASEDNKRMSDWLVIGLLALGTCGALAGLLTGFGIARGVSSRLVQLSVPIRDAAGKLDEVVGPMTVSAGHSFEEVRGVLEEMSKQVGDVVERLQQSQQQALRAEQLAAVGQLAAGMAHELRNPLYSMKILVQSAAERTTQPAMSRRDIEVLSEEITRLEQLVSMFLDFARPPRVEMRPLDLREAVERGVDFVLVLADQLHVEIDIELPDEAVWVVGDVGQLRQVLLNLLLNALDALTEGGRVHVSLARTSSAQRPEAWLTVADDGPGLPSQLGDRIFDPFVSTKETGVGLGLSICKRIAEAHGGSISANNAPKGGARFEVRLPSLDPASLPSQSHARPLAEANVTVS